VEGVYTRDGLSPGLASCQYISFENTPVNVAASAVSPSTQSTTTQLSAAVATSLASASPVPASRVCGLSPPPPVKPVSPAPVKSLCTVPPLKTGILPPTAANISAVTLSRSATNEQTAPQSQGWKEFAEALSEEFDSPDDASRQTKGVPVLSAHMLLPKPSRDPSDEMLSTGAFCALHSIVASSKLKMINWVLNIVRVKNTRTNSHI